MSPRPRRRSTRLLAALACAALAAAAPACARRAPDLPEVRLHASSDLPGEVVREVAARFGVARVTLVATAEEAEVAWVSDPAAALALRARRAPGGAPAAEGVDPRWLDPAGRFAPLGARARVLLRAPGLALPASPVNYRDLADRRLAGQVVVAHPGRGAGPVTAAALALVYGEESALKFHRLLARATPLVVERDADVRAALSSGKAAVGLAGSPEAAAGAASAAALEVIYPDQQGRGAVVLPTAVVVLEGARPGAVALAAWLVGPRAEALLVARAPGLLPLRAGVPVPVGVEPAPNLVALPLDWDALHAEVERLAPVLARWPEGFAEGGALAAPPARP